ncbi:MAG: hypothetical protein IPJ88_09570 [Myxococcales bacterium]|nr:MAG: hypothetical protein IPJ88_09570 [Myxococcales bacterium]
MKLRYYLSCSLLLSACTQADGGNEFGEYEAVFQSLSPEELPAAPEDISNAYADDSAAAALGQKFFDTRFSGPLLESDNNGLSGTVGNAGETGKLACASCHVPEDSFVDTRSTRYQVSLGAGWTTRRAPSLLDVGQAKLLMWDGRHDAAYNQVFAPIEKAMELNSSRLFVAQQIQRYYLGEYESVFGPFPDISAFAALDASEAGCTEMPHQTDSPELVDRNASCEKPYDDNVTRVAVNFGKALSAYLRQLSCGQSRFDNWVHGDSSALNDGEKRGALLFVGKAGCVSCHSGPFFSDQRFYNVGLPSATVANFMQVGNDPGASEGLAAMLEDPLNVRGIFSDGDDGRLDAYESIDFESLLGAFRTPGLRCVAQRPTYSHTGQLRSLEDVVAFFSKGGASGGFLGTDVLSPLDLTDAEETDLVAFLKTLDGPGPDPALLTAP